MDNYERFDIKKDPFGPIYAVACNGMFFDPAIDVDNPEMMTPSEAAMVAEYIKTRDLNVLRFKDGVKPNLFRIARLPRRSAEYMRSLPNRRSAALMAFAYSVHYVLCSDNTEVKLQNSELTSLPDKAVAPKDEEAWYARVGDVFGNDTLVEMGEVAMQLSALPRAARGPFFSSVGLGQTT